MDGFRGGYPSDILTLKQHGLKEGCHSITLKNSTRRVHQWFLEIAKEFCKLYDNIISIARRNIQTIMGIFNFHMVMCDHTCNNKILVNNINLT
jgi:transposase-like protein